MQQCCSSSFLPYPQSHTASFPMDEIGPVTTTVVPRSEVSDDRVADVEPEIFDSFYYFHNIVFKVEDTLFCVPRNAFEIPNGNFFSETLFSIPGPGKSGEQTEGHDSKHPILLEGIAKEHFRGFLRVMYPFNGAESTTKYEDWVGVLHLATKWEFAEIRAKSIQVLSDFLKDKPVIDKILLAKKYHVKDWLFAGYTNLILQDQLDLNQLLLTLDTLTIARLFLIQNIILKSGLSTQVAYPQRVQYLSTVPQVTVGPYEIRTQCGDCGTQLKFDPPKEADVRHHVSREFASEIITW